MNPFCAIKTAINLLGGQNNLARAVSKSTGKAVSQGMVWNWVNRAGKAPPWACKHIEALTEGRVTAEQLRPDVFAPLGVSVKRKRKGRG